MKRSFVLFLVFVLLSFSACGADTGTPSSSPPSSSPPSLPPDPDLPTATLVSYDYLANEAMKPMRQDVYAEKDGYSLPLNLYAPSVDNANADTAVLCIHGGGWSSNLTKDGEWDGNWMRHQARYYSLLGFWGLEVTYRGFGGGVSLSDIFEDVADAVRYVKTELYTELGIERLIVIGDSAGGHLALCLALTEDASLHPDGVIACNPVSDFSHRFTSYITSGEQATLSPMHLAESAVTDTKILLMHGDADTVVPYTDSQLLLGKLTAAGNDAALSTVAGGAHAFILYGYEATPHDIDIAMKRTVEFIYSLYE
ncbi:MAG: alpha/beta hydrolase [Clostridia bacterium]|nr:alpha/beta hydrolase [Clostridia bacterium]